LRRFWSHVDPYPWKQLTLANETCGKEWFGTKAPRLTFAARLPG
jgi:hypothetical protein